MQHISCNCMSALAAELATLRLAVIHETAWAEALREGTAKSSRQLCHYNALETSAYETLQGTLFT